MCCREQARLTAKMLAGMMLFLLLSLQPLTGARANPAPPEWSFAADGAFQMKDGWTVYRDEIVPPATLLGAACQAGQGGRTISAPDVWGPAFTTTVETGHGMATYCREVVLPKDDNAYAFRMGTLRSVSHIYAVAEGPDGSVQTWLLFKNGDLDESKHQVVANPAVPVIDLPYGTDRFTLVMQLSNHIHKQGGMVEVPILDYRWRLAAMENRATAVPSALVIVLLLVGIAAFTLGRQQGLSRSHKFFGFLSVAAAVRAAFVSDIIWDYFPAFSLARKYDLEYLSLFVIAFAYYGFIIDLLRPGRRRLIDYVIFGITGALIVFSLFLAPFFAPGTITLLREPVQIFLGTIILVLVVTVLKASIRNPETRREALTVSIGALVYAAYEILSVAGVIGASLEWSQFIIFAVMMVHAQAFVMQARRVERERDMLMASLEDTNRDLQNRALALDLALKEAEGASNAKSHFLATFSHELRTPLNAIIGFSELMSRELLGSLGSDIYREYAKDILASGTHLLQLVDDILDLARIEAGLDDLHTDSIDMVALAEEVTGILHLQAAQKDVSLVLDSGKRLPRLMGDERKMRQILINLIDNAIKFNVTKGMVRVGLHANSKGFCLEVVDTGLGIPEADLPTILSRFGPTDSERRKKNAGVGIGLPLSDTLVRQHGGTMKISSVLGEGTHITVMFPVNRLVSARTLEDAR